MHSEWIKGSWHIALSKVLAGGHKMGKQEISKRLADDTVHIHALTTIDNKQARLARTNSRSPLTALRDVICGRQS